MLVLPPASYGGPATPQGTSTKEQNTPHTPRAPGTVELPPKPSPNGATSTGPSTDVAVLRTEIEALQAQMKSVLDMLQDQGQSLAMEAQERCQLVKLLQSEREEREQSLQELREALESERLARARDRQDLADAIRGEVDARTSDVRELAKSLQSECNARAGEVKQLAQVFQSEREIRIQDAEELAETLRSEFANADPSATQYQSAGQRTASPHGEGESGQAEMARRLETAELAQRLNELTRYVMSGRQSPARPVEGRRKVGGPPRGAAS